MNRDLIHKLVDKERDRQDAKWGPEKWTSLPEVKYLVLAEEVGEVAEALLHADKENMIEELVQVAAVCFKWLEGSETDIVEGYIGEAE